MLVESLQSAEAPTSIPGDVATLVPGEQRAQAEVPDELGNEALDLLYSSVAEEQRKYEDWDRPSPPSFESDDEVTSTALRYLATRQVGYDELPVEDPDFVDIYGGGATLQLALGGQAVAGIRFYEKDGKAEIDSIGVHERLAGRGLGGRLMRAAVALMKDRGDTQLFSRNLSRDGFRMRVAVFGGDNLSFYYTDKHREHGIEGPPPANVKEAEAVLEKAYAAISPEDRKDMTRADAPYTFGVYVDLNKIDASGWERPVPAEVDALRVNYKMSG